MTDGDAALPEIYRPVVGGAGTPTTRLAETTRILGAVLAIVGVVLALTGVPGVVAASVFGAGVVSYFASRTLHERALAATRFIAEENSRIVALLRDGRLDEAARALDALLVRARVAPRPHAVLLVLRAALFTRANDVARARPILVAVHDSKLLGDDPSGLWNARVRSALAVVDAARGDVDAADAWLAPLEGVDEVSGELVVPRVVIAARRGLYAEAVAAAAASAPGDADNKTLGVLRAFSIERSAPDGARAGEVESSLRAVGPVDASDIDYLRSAWPTLTAFCAAHRLAPVERAESS